MYKIFLHEEDENDATDYYLRIIESAIAQKGDKSKRVYNTGEIAGFDKVITINLKEFFRVWLKNRKQYIIHWFQGIMPEENMMLFENKIERFPRKWLYTILEKLVLKRAVLVLFVSGAMQQHYSAKYGYKKDNFLVMPCFNQQLDTNCFFEERYAAPTFVYAGSLSKWQCIDQMLILFKRIKEIIANAKLTLLTKEQEEAERLLRKYDLAGEVEIKYIQYRNLNPELQKYKFGFLIRENIAVNNVATPTKMNSYMANGVIPVYSPVIADFEKNITGCKYAIAIKDLDTLEVFYDMAYIDTKEMLGEYKRIFDSYYNKDMYIEHISNRL